MNITTMTRVDLVVSAHLKACVWQHISSQLGSILAIKVPFSVALRFGAMIDGVHSISRNTKLATI